MNDHEFEHKPLGFVFRGLERSDELSLPEIKADLVAKGYDPDALVARLKARAKELSSKSRLAWMEEGNAVQAKLDSVLQHMRSWTQRSAEEVNRAFNDVVSGRYGPQAKLRVQTAFKNVTELTPQSKAAFLDEVDALLELEKKSEPPDSK